MEEPTITVVSISRDDFENMGYDGSKVTMAQMINLAEQISDATDCIVTDQMEAFAQELELPLLDE